jgi:large subunit ribosomal protein L6
MSRIGKLPIQIPSGVTITVDPDFVTVAGAKGTLKQFTMPGVTVTSADGVATVTRADDEPVNRAKHGLMRALINNMVVGVTKGFSKQLEINGVGYRVAAQGSDLKFNLGFSHDVIYKMPQGVSATIEQNKITVSGIDRNSRAQEA